MVFDVHEDVLAHCELMDAVTNAIKLWNCATGMNWKLGNIVSTVGMADDGISTIYFDETINANAMAPSFGNLCIDNTSFEIDEIDIIIRSSVPTTSPGGWTQTILHEFGHAHGLAHTLAGSDGVQDLMVPGNIGAVSPSVTEVANDDLSGALDIWSYSNSFTNNCGTPMTDAQTGDLYMKDCWADTGKEANCDCNISDAGGEWQNIWSSPDIWNCEGGIDCDLSAEAEPIEGLSNRMRLRIRNRSQDCASTAAQAHVYWTVASTGELWQEHWIDSDSGDNCIIGNEMMNSPIVLPNFDPAEELTLSVDWTAPLFTDFTTCPDIGTPPEPGKFQICFLARIVSDHDFILAEAIGPIAPNVVHSNNLVTKNTFIIADGFAGAPLDPRYILVENNNESIL